MPPKIMPSQADRLARLRYCSDPDFTFYYYLFTAAHFCVFKDDCQLQWSSIYKMAVYYNTNSYYINTSIT